MTKKTVTENLKRAAEKKHPAAHHPAPGKGTGHHPAHKDTDHHKKTTHHGAAKPRHELKPAEAFIEGLRAAGIADGVLAAMASLDRPSYFDAVFADEIWGDQPIPIGLGQMSDEPLALARMIQRLNPHKNWRVLEVGTGSGYSTGVLSRLCREVVTIEAQEGLVGKAKERLITDGCHNVRYFVGEVSEDQMPDLDFFDGIIIWAACSHTPYSVVNQLKEGGVAVYPMGPAHQQQIVRYVHRPDAEDMTRNYSFHEFCLFGPLRGRYGWKDREPVPSFDETPSEG